MPSVYAHYRFGFRTMAILPEEITACIRRNRQMFDLGLHGPDFLFYYNPFVNNKTSQLGSDIHHQTGRTFFSRAARQLKLQPSEAGQAYILGVLAHFALDSQVHPFVNEMDGLDAGHVEMETEFDRYLLELDGKPDPHLQNISRHIRLRGPGDAAEIARFYPGVKANQVKTCFFNMGWMEAFITAPEGPRRQLMDSGVLGTTISKRMMTTQANPHCKELTPQIYALYTKAEHLYPKLARQLWDHLHRGGKLGEEFDTVFG